MSKKLILKRVLSGVLSMVSVFSATLSPMTAYAAEKEEPSVYEASYPWLEEVKAQLSEDEIVTAADIEIAYGSAFEIQTDFEGIEYDEEKVSVKFHEAESDSGQDFSTYHADTYQATYYVEPVSGNPSYKIARTIVIKEPETETVSQSDGAGQDGGGESEESGESDEDGPSQTETVTETATPSEAVGAAENLTEEVGQTETENASETEAQSETESEKETETNAVTETETATETETEAGTEIPTETETDVETESDTENSISLMSEDEQAPGVNANKSFISGFAVKHLADGTAPFDEDDAGGNDSSPQNHVVRTFDNVAYTLEYTTALMDTSQTVDEAYMMVEFSLDCDPSVAEFNKDTLNWCLDRKITYHYSDGTTSDSWDSSKEVVRQVLTGKRYLSRNEEQNAIPGVGTLSVGIYVKAAKNGDTLEPTFSVWMEGNEESLKRTITGDEVTVTAAPRYNIRLAKNTNCDYLGYFDTENGMAGGTDSDGAIYGRLEGYTLVVQLYNTSVDKGLKGIELPAGDITFDVILTEKLNGEDVTDSESYAPILWDYRENTSGNRDTVGKLGRQMYVGGKDSSTYGTWAAPWNSGGATSPEYGCYEGGSLKITRDANQGNICHVTVSDYSFDLEDFDFPTNNCSNTTGTLIYGPNIGCFAAGYVQFVCQFARTVEATSDLYFTVEVDNLKAATVSGQETTEDQNSADNTHGMNVTLYPAGKISKRNFFYTEAGRQIASVWSYGDSYAYQGQTLRIESTLDYSGDDYLSSLNILQKFDDKALEIPAGTDSYVSVTVTNSLSKLGDVRVLFAAKPDKTGWADEAEMNATREEQLIYFDSIDGLNAAGFTCVGYLYEVRNSQIYQGRGDAKAILFQMYVKVKESAEIGTVYQTTNDARAWRTVSNVMSWKDVDYSKGAYGLGDAGWKQGTFAESYGSPDYTLYSNYGKSVYEDGSIVSGHSGGYIAGNSVLIVGCKTGVSIEVADQTTTSGGNVNKSVYDLDAGERTATYVIHPSVSVVSENRDVETTQDTTNVTIKAILPDTLAYVMNSASLAPVDVTENEDGTSTVTWLVENQKIGEAMEDITLSCIIGEAGTPNDVQNNETITIAASISSDKDQRAITKAYGNYSDTTIAVIRLATSSVSKAVKDSLVELGNPITYILRYGNSAEEEVNGVRLYDILPYNGDARGSDFDGAYAITSIRMDFSNAADTFASGKDGVTIYGATDESARNPETAKEILAQTAKLSWEKISGGKMSGTSLIWENLSLKSISGLYFDIGTVKGQEYLTIEVTLCAGDGAGKLLRDDAGNTQEPGNRYANSFLQFADRQVAVVESNTVSTQVVERSVSGLAWLDENADGIRQEAETLLRGVTASLYRIVPSVYDTEEKAVTTIGGTKLYPAYDVLGNMVEAVKTGKDGAYAFTGLEAGNYVVVFTGTDEYGLTGKSLGEDDTVDSDAEGILSEDGGTLTGAYITGITLPELSEMFAYNYECAHNDVGLLTFYSGLTIKKVEGGTNIPLAGAVFVIKNADGRYLTFENGAVTGIKEKADESCYLITGTDGCVTVSGLPAGRMELSEQKAPEGYQKSEETWAVEVRADSANGWASYVTVDGERLEKELVIKNKTATTTVSVTKAWRDNDNQDGLRKDVTLRLTGTITLAGEEQAVFKKTGVIRAGGEQKLTFTDLPVYSYGLPITYSLSEDEIEGYRVHISQMEGSWQKGYSVVVTNTHDTELTEYSVVKVWEDDNDRDGLRPDDVTVKLIGSDGSERTAKIAADDNWQYTFKNLPVYWNEGTKIIYTLEENPVKGYVRQVSEADENHVFTVTNTHEVKTVAIPVEKIWEDGDDQDGLRQKEVTVVLTGSDGTVREAVLSEKTDWKYVFKDLPVYFNQGALISYSLQEKEVDGYTSEVISGENGYIYIVTNTHVPAVTDVLVDKVWEDADNQDGLRPDTIEVTLKGSDGNAYTAELTKENGYSYIFKGLPVYHNRGTKIAYSVEEAKVEGYTSKAAADETGYHFTLTNTHQPAVTEIPVMKIWEDNQNQDGVRQDSIQVTLMASNGMEWSAELNEKSGWTYQFSNLPVYWKEGTKVEYTLKEAPIDGYQADIVLNEKENGFIVINIHVPETTDITISKDWQDDENRDGIRPESIHVVLTGSDGEVYSADLNEDNGWKVTIPDLPVYFNQGEKITYSVSEIETDGYGCSVAASEDGYSFLLTNTHEIAVTEVSVVKTWEDAEDQDGVRPESIAVVLTGSDGNRYDATLTAENDWSYVFENLPVYWNEGTKIDYSLQEMPVDGYTHEIEADEDGYSFTITNTHVPAVTDVVVKKVWEDADNQDGIRPESIHVVLTGSDGEIYEADLTKENGFVHVFYDLPVYFEVGKVIDYTLSEPDVEHYTSKIEKSKDGYSFIVTNSYAPKATEIVVTKVWEDNEDKDGLRKDVELTLTGSDGSVYRGTISKDASEQKFVFKDLPVYAKGEKITYTLTEGEMAGYTAKITEEGGNFTVTNTHTPTEGTPDSPTVIPDTPKTGDDSHVGIWLVLMAVSLFGMIACVYGYRRRRG
nr:Cna B-type domain-containing protein [uncultured Clostridium sp.]